MNFLIIDTESAWDDNLHELQWLIDRRVRRQHRIASKRIFAAAALDLSLDEEGALSVNSLKSWTERDYGCDGALVNELFDHILFRPDHQVVTWSGLAAEVPLLTLTAMEYNLVLPPQLRAEQPFRRNAPRPHLDLALAMKGNGRQWSHLSEICLRLNVPVGLLRGKDRVDFPETVAQWNEVREHVSRDTLITGMALMSWLRVQGRAGIRTPEMFNHLCSWYLRNCNVSPEQRVLLEALCAWFEGEVANNLLAA